MWLWKNNKTYIFFKYLQAAPSLQTFFVILKKHIPAGESMGEYIAVFWYEWLKKGKTRAPSRGIIQELVLSDWKVLILVNVAFH